MGLRPLHDIIVVKLDPVPEKVGLWVPPSAEERVRTGKIISHGPGLRNKKGKVVPVQVRAGQRVAFFRENFEHGHGRAVMRAVQAYDENTGVIREDDILWEVLD